MASSFEAAFQSVWVRSPAVWLARGGGGLYWSVLWKRREPSSPGWGENCSVAPVLLQVILSLPISPLKVAEKEKPKPKCYQELNSTSKRQNPKETAIRNLKKKLLTTLRVIVWNVQMEKNEPQPPFIHKHELQTDPGLNYEK